MATQATQQTFAEWLGVSTATVGRLSKYDECFPRSKKVGRNIYYEWDSRQQWLRGRASNPDAVQVDDKVISGDHVLIPFPLSVDIFRPFSVA